MLEPTSQIPVRPAAPASRYRIQRTLLAVSLAFALYGCGGGDGGTTAGNGNPGGGNPGSGGQETGQGTVTSELVQAENTSVIAPESYAQSIQLSLGDDGQAVAAWTKAPSTATPSAVTPLLSATRSADGAWTQPVTIADDTRLVQTIDGGPALRANPNGRRAILAYRPRDKSNELFALFYTPGVGWSAPVPTSRGLIDTTPSDSDFYVEEDGSVIFTSEPDLYPITIGPRRLAEVTRLRTDGTASVLFTSTRQSSIGSPLPPTTSSFLLSGVYVPAHSGSKDGHLFWQESGVSDTYTSLGYQRGDTDPGEALFGALQMSVTPRPVRCSGRVLKATANDAQYVTVLAPDAPAVGGTSLCSLVATQLDTRRFEMKRTVLAPDANILGVRLHTSKSGNILAVWSEARGRYKWSQSVGRGEWSEPAPLPGFADQNVEDQFQGFPTIAMNDAGQAVMTVVRRSSVGTVSSQQSVSYLKFDFEHGWSQPVVVAQSSRSLIGPAFPAINNAGQAAVAYSAERCFKTTSGKDVPCEGRTLYLHAF